MKTQILANGVSVIQSTTKSNSDGIVRYTDLGLSAYNQTISNSEEGFITLNSSEPWAPSYNLWTTTLNTVLPHTLIFGGEMIIDPARVEGGENTPATIQQYLDIPKSLLVTTMGSLDVQFTIQNIYTANVDSIGTPNYILSFSNPQYTPALNVGYHSTDIYTYNNLGTPQNTAPFIVGNASTLGTNYTVINAQFNELIERELGLLTGYDDSLYANPGPYYYGAPLNSTVANCVRGTVTLVIDAAKSAGLSDDKFVDTKINKTWRGNYKYTAFSAIFKFREERYWDIYYGNNPGGVYNDRMEYAINMIPVTADADSPDYGKFTATIIASSPSSYNSLNLGCRWLVSINKFRNFVI
jgi:hypothetical protein